MRRFFLAGLTAAQIARQAFLALHFGMAGGVQNILGDTRHCTRHLAEARKIIDIE